LLIVPFGVAVLLFRSHEKIDLIGLQPLGFIVVLIGLLALAWSESRSAMMAIWMTLVWVLVRGVRSWVWRLPIGTLVMASPLLVVASLPATSRASFLLTASLLWRTVGERAYLLSSGVEQWRESLWFGIGMNEYRNVFTPPILQNGANPGDTALWPTRDYDVAHVHNVFLQTALDVGLVGLAAYCGVLGLLLFKADQAARGPTGPGRAAAVGGGLSLVAISMFGLGDAVALGAKVGLFQWLAAGLILAAWRTQLESTG
jgi:O-antigen ligase